MKFKPNSNAIVLRIVLIMSELHKTICVYETYFMNSYCSSSALSNSKSQSTTSNTAIIQLGRDSCTSAATLTAYRTEYPNNAKCEVTVKSSPGFGLIAVLKYASFRAVLPCATDRDELFVSINKTLQFNISSSYGEDFATDISDNDIVVKFVTSNLRDPVEGKGFELYFTAYKPVDSLGVCSDGYFNCDNSRCVHNGLKCDQIDNCGNNRDENGCDYGVSSIWLLLAISGWIFSGFNVIGIFLWVSYQKYFEFNLR